MTNEDVIDLYNRTKMGATVVVIAAGQGDLPFNPQMALTNDRFEPSLRPPQFHRLQPRLAGLFAIWKTQMMSCVARRPR